MLITDNVGRVKIMCNLFSCLSASVILIDREQVIPSATVVGLIFKYCIFDIIGWVSQVHQSLDSILIYNKKEKGLGSRLDSSKILSKHCRSVNLPRIIVSLLSLDSLIIC